MFSTFLFTITFTDKSCPLIPETCSCSTSEFEFFVFVHQVLEEMKSESKPIKIDRRLTGSSIIDEPMQQVPSTKPNGQMNATAESAHSCVWGTCGFSTDELLSDCRAFASQTPFVSAHDMRQTLDQLVWEFRLNCRWAHDTHFQSVASHAVLNRL